MGSGERTFGEIALEIMSCGGGAGGAIVSGGKLKGMGGGCRRAGGLGGNSGSTGGGVTVVGAAGGLLVGGGFASSSSFSFSFSFSFSSLRKNGSGEKRRSALPVGVLSRSTGGCVSAPNAASNAESATDHLAPGSKFESADALKSKHVHLLPADGVEDALVGLVAEVVGAVPRAGRSSPLDSGSEDSVVEDNLAAPGSLKPLLQ